MYNDIPNQEFHSISPIILIVLIRLLSGYFCRTFTSSFIVDLINLTKNNRIGKLFSTNEYTERDGKTGYFGASHGGMEV